MTASAVREASDLYLLLFTLCARGSDGKATVRIGGTNDIPYAHSHGTAVFPRGMTWLHYDWKAHREMDADGSLLWQS